jgi:hypothetical protein
MIKVVVSKPLKPSGVMMSSSGSDEMERDATSGA